MHRIPAVGMIVVGVCFLGLAWGGAASFAPFLFRVAFSVVPLLFICQGVAILMGFTPGADGQFGHLKRMMDEYSREFGKNRPGAQRTDDDDEPEWQTDRTSEQDTNHPGRLHYTCPSCQAAIGSQAEVSPHGDVRCKHCGRWYNIHKES